MRPVFTLFGDSITQFSFGPGGWGAALANDWQRHADIRLRGYSGYNTRWALHLLPHLFPSGGRPEDTPALVVVFLGANDATALCTLDYPGRLVKNFIKTPSAPKLPRTTAGKEF